MKPDKKIPYSSKGPYYKKPLHPLQIYNSSRDSLVLQKLHNDGNILAYIVPSAILDMKRET